MDANRHTTEIEQQAFLQGFFDSSSLMLGIVELDGEAIITLHVNPSAARFLNRLVVDICHHTAAELGTSPAESRIWLDHYRQALAQGTPVHFEYHRPYPGVSQWISATVTCLNPGHHGRPRCSFVAEDVTERKQAEAVLAASLRESEARFHGAFNNAAIGFAMTNLAGLFEDANAAYCALTGYTLDELHAFAFSQLVHPADRAENMALIQQLKDGQIPDFVIQNRYIRKDGQVVWVRKSVSAARDTEGQPRWIIALVEDITGRKRREMNAAFVADISNDFARLSTPDEIMQAIGEKMYRHYNLTRLTFFYVNEPEYMVTGVYDRHEPGLISVIGEQHITDFVDDNFLSDFKAGRMVVVNDLASDPRTRHIAEAYDRLGVAAQLLAPFMSGGQWRFIIALQKSVPYLWRQDEIELLEELAPRIYYCLERAHAEETLRLSEAALRTSQAELAAELTERAHTTAVLQSAAARDAYRVRLADALRPLADPLEIKAAVMRLLGEYLDVDRVMYGMVVDDGKAVLIESDYCRLGVSSLVGLHHLADFGKFVTTSLRAGRTIVFEDMSQSPELTPQERAIQVVTRVHGVVSVPLVKFGHFLAYLAVNTLTSHVWTDAEIALIEDTAERTWSAVERAQAEAALRESEHVRFEANERFRTSIESLNEAFAILSAVREDGIVVDLRFEYVNQAACLLSQLTNEQLVGHTVRETMPYQPASGLFEKFVQVVNTGQPLSEQSFSFEGKSERRSRVSIALDLHAVKFGDGLIVTADDVTEQVRLAAEHQEAIKEREIHHRLSEQREKERQTYARDIHDGPVQTLSSLAFSLQYLKEQFPDPALALELDAIRLSVKEAVSELRQVINELRPPSVIRFGLSKAIQVHVENLRERYPQVRWHLNLANDEQVLPEQTCLSLFRIYQEAVSNIIRHAEANQAWIIFRVYKNHVSLEIRDNGKGLAQDQDLISLTSSQHFGLAGIEERVEAINGEMEITSHPGKGTTIEIRAPIKQI